MGLEDIASISGKPGLYKIIKPTRTGVILESLDEKKIKLIITSTNKVSILKDISIYTTDTEGAIPLKKVFYHLHQQIQGKCPVTDESPSHELLQFMKQLVPNYDEDRVYISHIKKLINWYTLLATHLPDIFLTLNEKEETNASNTEQQH